MVARSRVVEQDEAWLIQNGWVHKNRGWFHSWYCLRDVSVVTRVAIKIQEEVERERAGIRYLM